jgi:O-antigen/teichoic acid export membrane protein
LTTTSKSNLGAGDHFLKNALSWLASSLAGRVVTSLLFILLTNYASLAETGAYTLGLTFLVLLTPLSLWGLDQLFIRDAAQDREHVSVHLRRILLPRLLLAIATYLLLVILVYAIDYTETTRRIILIMGASLITENISGLLQAYFVTIEKTIFLVYVMLPVNLVRLLVGYLILVNGGSATGLAVIFTVTSLFTLLLLAKGVLAHTGSLISKESFDIQFWRQQLKIAYPFVLFDFFWAAELHAGQILISVYWGEEATGLYATAFMIVSLLTLISHAYMITIFPAMSRLYRTSRESLKFVYDRSVRYLLLMALLPAVLFSVMGRDLLGLVFPESYAAASPVLAILGWSLVFTFLNVPNSRLLIIQNRQDKQALYMGISAVSNITLNFWLIPQLGILGAAIARVISSLVFFLPNYLTVYWSIYSLNLLRVAIGPVLISAGMITILILLKSWHVWFALTSSIIFFIGAVLLSRIVTVNDLRLFQRVLEGKSATYLSSAS